MDGSMSTRDLIFFITFGVGFLSTIVGAVWVLSSKLSAISGKLDGFVERVTAEQRAQDKLLDQHGRAVEQAVLADRSGREKLWVEVNGLRERVVALEVKSGVFPARGNGGANQSPPT